MTDTRTETWTDDAGYEHLSTCDCTSVCRDCHGAAVANSDGDICQGCGGSGWFRCTGCA